MFEPSQTTKTSNKPEDLSDVKPENLPGVKNLGVMLLRLFIFLKLSKWSLEKPPTEKKKS